MFGKTLSFAITASLIAGCSTTAVTRLEAVPPASAAPMPDQLRQRAQITPVIDHHQHIMSAAALSLILDRRISPVKTISLPAELEALIQKRERASGTTAITDLYAPDVLMVDTANGNRWIRGREAAQRQASLYTPDTRFVPVSYWIDGRSAQISGVVRTGDSPVDEMTFVFLLRKNDAGRWEIALENSIDKPPPDVPEPVTAARVTAAMDEAGIQRAVLLSTAYMFGLSTGPYEGEYEKVKAENDWNVAQAQSFPGRFVVFCSVNPLRSYALEEIERCSHLPLVRGLKLHFANSRVDVHDPKHLAQLQKVFRAANDHKMSIVAHVWVRGDYGKEQSQIFLDKLLPEAPDVTVQVAHLAGSGPGGDFADALPVFADAVARGDPRTKNLYFDVATNVAEGTSPEEAELIVKRLRQIGLHRILFGSDMMTRRIPRPAAQWATLKRILPLTNAELETIADNVAPYMRGGR